MYGVGILKSEQMTCLETFLILNLFNLIILHSCPRTNRRTNDMSPIWAASYMRSYLWAQIPSPKSHHPTSWKYVFLPGRTMAVYSEPTVIRAQYLFRQLPCRSTEVVVLFLYTAHSCQQQQVSLPNRRWLDDLRCLRAVTEPGASYTDLYHKNIRYIFPCGWVYRRLHDLLVAGFWQRTVCLFLGKNMKTKIIMLAQV